MDLSVQSVQVFLHTLHTDYCGATIARSTRVIGRMFFIWSVVDVRNYIPPAGQASGQRDRTESISVACGSEQARTSTFERLEKK